MPAHRVLPDISKAIAQGGNSTVVVGGSPWGTAGVLLVSADTSYGVEVAEIAADDVVTADAALSVGVIPVGDDAKGLEDATPVALGTVTIDTSDGDTDDAIVALFDALKAFGLVSGTWTAAGE